METLKKTSKILNRIKHKSIIFLIILSFCSIIFESISIGLLVPLAGAFLNKDYLENSEFFQNLAQITEDFIPSSIYTNDSFFLIILTFYIIIFLFRHFFIFFFHYKKNFFNVEIKKNLSGYLTKKYLVMPYDFFNNQNSSYLMRNVNSNVDLFSSNVINIITMAGDLITMITILTILLIFSFKVTLIASVILIIIGFLISYFSKKTIYKLSHDRQNYVQRSIQILKQSFEGIKEVKLFNKEKVFANNYANEYGNLARVDAISDLIVIIPRIIIELLLFFFVVFFIVYFTSKENFSNLENYLPIIILYIGAIYRLMPYANKLIMGIQQLKFAMAPTEVIFSQLEYLDKHEIKNQNEKKNKVKLNFSYEILINDISFSYSNKKILNNLSLKILKNEIIGLVGESGSGKSTLVDLICGLRRAESGNIFLDGKDINQNIIGWQKLIGYVPQQVYILDDTLENNIAFGSPKYEIKNDLIIKSLFDSGLGQFYEDRGKDTTINIGEKGSKLSGGQIQRIGIARALYNDPDILILDESTSSLDWSTEERILNTLKELKDKGKTIIIVSHKIKTLSVCDKIFELKNGKAKIFNYNN